MINRVIKFRGKCTRSGDWVYGDLIHGVGSKKGNLYILPSNTNLAYVKHCDPLDGVMVIPETVGQFTGLQDHKEADIYDGDILQSITGERCLVWQEPGVWLIGGLNKEYDDYLTKCAYYEAEVIGSIHTHPHLLTPTPSK